MNIHFDKKNYSDKILLKLYKVMLQTRIVEEKMLILLRQGVISKWFSGMGQEAISVGSVLGIDQDEWILPLHRNLGVFLGRGIKFEKLFAQWQGKKSGFTKARDRSFHFGDPENHIFGMISHLGPQMAVADGLALAQLLAAKEKVTVVFCGDGGTSQGDFHEAINVAAVWNLPVIFLIENNGYSLSTPTNQQYNCESLIDKAPGYGIDGLQIDGNNVLEVYHTFKTLSQSMRENPRPVLVEALTFRIRGHEEASGIDYIPDHLIKEWSAKDPIVNFENYLKNSKVLTEQIIQDYESEIIADVDSAINKIQQEENEFDIEEELADVYSPFEYKNIDIDFSKNTKLRFIDAITDAMALSMEKHQNLIIMGQDIAEYGGVFKATEGFVEKYGKERIRNTPLCESAIVGTTLGLSAEGFKSIVEIQFSDFATCAFNQIVNNLAKIHYRWGLSANTVIRMPCGAGLGAGPFHSQTNEAWFTHVPGLKIVYPSNPLDAKGLLCEAINDPNPVLFFEHKALYRSISDYIPDQYYTTEIGKGTIARNGDSLSVITYGMGVVWAKKLSEEMYYDIEIVDLRTLQPWDKDIVTKSIKKTGKVIVLTEANAIGGFGAEIASWISENLFEFLDAPVARISSLDTPIPFAQQLEKQYLPIKRLKEKIEELLNY